MNEVEKQVEDDLRKGWDDTIIKFTVKAENTKDNMEVHDAFREFCRLESKNDYTLGLRLLLQGYDQLSHFNALWSRISDVETRLSEIEKPKQKDNGGTF